MERLRKYLRWATYALLLAAVLVGPKVVWHFLPTRTLGVVIVDKTMPKLNYREHAGVPWLLHAMKVAQPDGRFLTAADYVGYDPVAKVGHDLTKEHLRDADLLVVTDTYGVYVNDYGTDTDSLERSPKIYGGFTTDETAAMTDFVARGHTIIAEFNTFADPTAGAARDQCEHLFGAHWTHWVGRYWEHLESTDEVPRWVSRIYEHVYGQPFDLKGPGLVFVKDDSDMVVLRGAEHLNPEVLDIVKTTTLPELAALPDNGKLLYWMDILERTTADVYAEYHLDVTKAGAELLAKHGVPQTFPAFIGRKIGRGATYYFAGDFIDTRADLGDPERAGVVDFRKWARGSSPNLEDAFLWGYYMPAVRMLIRNVPDREK